MVRWIPGVIIVTFLLALAMPSVATTQTKIRPSKKDVILQKLEKILENQGDTRKRLERLEKAIDELRKAERSR